MSIRVRSLYEIILNTQNNIIIILCSEHFVMGAEDWCLDNGLINKIPREVHVIHRYKLCCCDSCM